MKIILCSFTFLFLFSCQEATKTTVDTESRCKYASLIRFIKHSSFTEVQIINPDSGEIHKKYAFSSDLSAIPRHKEFIPIHTPIPSLIALSGTDIGMIAKLKAINCIRGISNIRYIDNHSVKENYRKGMITPFEDVNQLNPEKVLELTQLITYSGFGTPIQQEDKLSKLGINCIPIYDWRENHPLGKAEWIKLYGLLLGKEKEAEAYFAQIEKEYHQLKNLVKKVPSKPQVLSGSMIGDVWFMPAAESFNANLIKDAKGNFAGKNERGTGSSSFTFEEVFQRFRASDIWINPMFDTKSKLIRANHKYRFFEAFKNDRIYCYSHQMNHFWENSAIEPQKVLSDLIQIFHEGKVPRKKLHYYRKIRS